MGLQRIRKVALCAVLTLCLSATSSAFASNETSKDNPTINKIEVAIKNLNEKYESKAQMSINYNEITKDFTNVLENKSIEEITNYLEKYYTDTDKIEKKITIEEQESLSFASTSSTGPGALPFTTYKNRIGKVSMAVPSLGVATLNILFNSTLDANKYFQSGEVITSYQTGVAIGQWSHINGTFEIAYYQTYATLRAHGTLTYGIPNTPLSITTDQTVQYTDSWMNY